MQKRLLFIACLLLAIGQKMVAADGSDLITISDFSIYSGQSKEIGIELTNRDVYVGFQFDLQLPQGFTVSTYSANASRIPDGTSLRMAQQTDGSYRFVAAALDGSEISGNSGTVVNITVAADQSLTESSYTGYIRAIKLSKADGSGTTVSEEQPFTITVKGSEAYAVLSENNTVLTFYYDDRRTTNNGLSVGPFNTYSKASRGWSPYINQITKAVFDQSFDQCTSLTSTAFWFTDMDHLETIENIQYLHTDNVEDMECMFDSCLVLRDLDVSRFVTAKVRNMKSTFEYCSSLTSLDLSHFNTASVTDMTCMFMNCSGLTSLSLNNLNTESVTSMSNMFMNCSGLTSIDLQNINTNNVTTMYAMFFGCENLSTLDVSSFNTANVTDMSFMFGDCKSLTQITWGSNFNTEKVTSMRAMFQRCWSMPSIDVSGFNTSNVTSMEIMFTRCYAVTGLNLSNFNTEKVTTMHGMFYMCDQLSNLNTSSFNTSNVTDMGEMFYGCSAFTSLDVSNFNTAAVTSMKDMFYNCSALKTINAGSEWSTASVTEGDGMFTDCTSLKGGAGTAYDASHIDYTYAHIDGGTSNPGYFTDKNAAKEDVTVQPASGGDIAEAVNRAVEGKNVGDLTIDLASDGSYTLKSSITVPGSLTIQGNNATIDASALEAPFIALSAEPTAPFQPKNDGSGDTDYYSIEKVIVDGVKVTGLKNSIFYDNNVKYVVLDFAITNSLFQLATEAVQNDALIAFQAGGAKDFTVKNSTIYGNNAVAKYFLRYNNASRVDRYGFVNDGDTWSFTYENNTFYGLLSKDNRQWGNYGGVASGTNQLVLTVKNNIWVDCDSLIMRRMLANKTFNGCHPSSTMANNLFNNEGAVADQKNYGNGTDINGVMAFTDAANGNFNGEVQLIQGTAPKTTLGAPRWTVTFLQSVSEPYAVLSENNTVLTFFYDDQKQAKNGMSVGPFNDLNDQPWKNSNSSITSVVFDSSFTQCLGITSTAYWFCGLDGLSSIKGIDNLKTDNVTNMEFMFDGCSSLTNLDIANFNTAKVTSMNDMFVDCSSLTSLDLSSFNTSNVTTMTFMFIGCSNLKTIYVGKDWSMSNVSAGGSGNNMFSACFSLVGGRGTTYSADHTGVEYARIDKAPSAPGYLTGPDTEYKMTLATGENGAVTAEVINVAGATEDTYIISRDTTIRTVTVYVPSGYQVKVTMTPVAGYQFSTLSKDNTQVTSGIVDGENNSKVYTFTNIDADCNVNVAFAPVTYTITYNLAGGTLPDGVANPMEYTIETPNITLPTPTREGYTFGGWVTESDPNTVVSTIAQGSTGNRTYIATWLTGSNYTISYDLAGGAYAEGVSNPVAYNVETETFTLNNPTREGYTFTGWTGTGLTEATTTVTIEKGSTGNRRYTATWSLDTYIITLAAGANGNIRYQVDNADAVTITAETTGRVQVTNEQTITLTFVPASGYKFEKLTKDNTEVTVEGDTYIIRGVTADASYTATFAVDTSGDGLEIFSINKSTTYASNQPITATPSVTMTPGNDTEWMTDLAIGLTNTETGESDDPLSFIARVYYPNSTETFTFKDAVRGTNNPHDANGVAYDYKQKNLPAEGAYMVFETSQDGSLIIPIRVTANKSLFVTEADGTLKEDIQFKDADGNTLRMLTSPLCALSETDNLMGYVSFNAKAGSKYYVFCNGSKPRYAGYVFSKDAIDIDPVTMADVKDFLEGADLNDGDTFTATNGDGVELRYRVISAADKTCQIGDKPDSNTSSIYDEPTAVAIDYAGVVKIPEIVKGYNVVKVGYEAFCRCAKVTEVQIPNTVLEIENWAFAYSGITSITLPASVTSFDRSSISNCSDLMSITVDSQNQVYDSRNGCNAVIETASNKLIRGCATTKLSDIDGVVSIGHGAFQYCEGKEWSMTLPNTVTTIENAAFQWSDLTAITLPSSLKTVGNNVFDHSKVTSIVVPASVTSVGVSAFSTSTLESLTVEEGNTTYDSRDNCNALIETATNKLICGTKATVIPNTVTAIAARSFVMVYDLTSVTLPASISEIGSEAFYYSGLESITSLIGTPFEIVENAFDQSIYENCELHVPAGTADSYRNTQYWSSFRNIVENVLEPAIDGNGTMTVEGDMTMAQAVEAAGGSTAVNEKITSIVWNSSVVLTDQDLNGFGNPNMLVFVEDATKYSGNRNNVVVGDVAEQIVLKDTVGNNNFFCPKRFTAKRISYTHNYKQATQVGVSRGWETIALPFSVQTITHEKNGTLVPFGVDGGKPFWLRELTENGLVSARRIEAYVPYLISMPNNSIYPDDYNQAGNVTFSATDAVVAVTEQRGASGNNRTLIPTCQRVEQSASVYAINLNEAYESNAEGSIFVANYREVRPFEAYVEHPNGGARYYTLGDLADMDVTSLQTIHNIIASDFVKVYNLSGVLVKSGKRHEVIPYLTKGVYIINGSKVVIK